MKIAGEIDYETCEGLAFLNPTLQRAAADHLLWIEGQGVGYFEVTDQPYDQAYFDRYADQAESEIGGRLMTARAALVAKHWSGGVVDVGIGSGAFLDARRDPRDRGFDVNPVGIEWLELGGMFQDIYAEPAGAATFWDSLEHIRRPDLALARVRTAAFVSLPIFRDVAHVLASKHFRPDEHYWYWTRAGFLTFADRCGFAVVEHNTMESLIGREDIETFVLARKE